MSYNSETGMYEGYIYKITNDINNKLYIGQTTTTIKNRWRQHKTFSKKACYALYNSINCYGIEHFKITQVEKIECDTKQELYDLLNEKEIYWIKYYNSYNNGYNSTPGGDNISFKILKPVAQYDKKTLVLLNTFNSITEAGEFIGDTRPAMLGLISACCKGNVKSVAGYIWRYIGDELFKYSIYRKSFLFDQYDIKTGELINEKLCTEQIKEMLNREDVSAIYKNANNTLKTAYGYIWKFNKDSEKFSSRHHTNSNFNCYTIDNVFVKTFSSVKDALAFAELKCKDSIYQACKKENHYAGGYKWFYSDDLTQPDKSKIIN